MLATLDLHQCMNTRVGDDQMKGISGGIGEIISLLALHDSKRLD